MNTQPLSPICFHIMLAVAGDPAGCDLIVTRIAYDTFGELDLVATSLQPQLELLLSWGWLSQVEQSYQLTPAGRDVLQQDLYRWRLVARRADRRLWSGSVPATN